MSSKENNPLVFIGSNRAKRLLGIIHSNVFGPVDVDSMDKSCVYV